MGPSTATLLWGWDRTGRDGIRQDGIGWGRPHSPRCPNMQVQGNDPRAAPSVGNRQNPALCFTCLSRVIPHSPPERGPFLFPGYFLAFCISPCCSTLQCSPPWYLPAPLPGAVPTPTLPGGSVSLPPAARQTNSREGTCFQPVPPSSFLLSFFLPPQSWAIVCDAAV